MSDRKNEQWFSSKEALKALKINACELMHRRERGELTFEKRGNAYFYRLPTRISHK
ncbi:hypothetical protein [Pseudoalteromonas ruthenica]|uniref:hypothetical protein n=1 Tax=Pseudoalteromonas ruthenica TaxID=151081 RepID=UPI000B265A93|nr:hypothetical protein [Pseudoalteromonas ruthenica]